MTTPEDVGQPRLADVHPLPELAALVGGELEIEALRTVVRHVRRCPSCQSELVEVAAASGALRHTEREHLPEALDAPTVPPFREPLATLEPPETESASVTTIGAKRRWMLAAAAAIVVLAGAGVLLGRGLTKADAPTARIAFAPVGSQPAQGSVAMTGTGISRTMNVAVILTTPPARTYYEVWLLDVRTGGMVPVGVLPPSGNGTFALPTAVVARYNAVDISLQPDNGSTVHSPGSVLRANYTI